MHYVNLNKLCLHKMTSKCHANGVM